MTRRVVVERVTTYTYELEGTTREVEDRAIELAESINRAYSDKHIGEGQVISNEEI